MRSILFALGITLLYSSCQEAPANVISEPPAHKKAAPAATVKPQITTAPDSVCIAAVGDIMLGTSYPDNSTLPPDGAKSSFKNILNELQGADVRFGNLEGTLLDTGAPAH